jgi:DNA polymerase-3 subunit beta
MTILQFSIAPEALRSAFEIASKVTPKTTSLDILRHARLTAQNDTVTVMASNMELTVITPPPARVKVEGSAAIPAVLFHEWLREINGGEVSAIVDDKYKMKLVHGTDKTTLSCMSIDDYPELPTTSGQPILELPSEQFARMVDRVVFSAHDDTARPQLGGVQINVENNTITMVTTDGLRLSVAQEDIEGVAPANALVQSKSLAEVSRACKGTTTVQAQLGNPSIFTIIGHPTLSTLRFVCPTIAAQFPTWERFIPASHSTSTVIPTAPLLAKLKMANILARDTNNRVQFTVDGDHVDIHALSDEVGDCDYIVSACTTGSPVTIVFNSTFTKQAIEALDSEDVELRLNSGKSAAVFVIPNQTTYRHMLMPMIGRGEAA